MNDSSIIHVVGLGPAGAGLITGETMQLLESGKPVFLRTGRHPAADDLAVRGCSFTTFDSLYEENGEPEAVYSSIAGRLVEEARRLGEIIYAVPGNPLVAERSVVLLREIYKDKVKVYPSVSFLDVLFPALGIDPVHGVFLADAGEIAFQGPRRIQPRQGTVLMQADSRLLASDTKLSLLEVYPPEHPVYICRGLGGPLELVLRVELAELDHQEHFDHLTTLYLPPLADEAIFDFQRLMEIIGILMGPEGCPWDRRQTHASLARHLIEESHEALEAIRREDWEHLCEELGDILLQVALHAQLARQEGYFEIADSLRSIEEKLIRRHPHVFGEAELNTPEEVVASWERIKTDEGGHASLLDGVTEDLPALLFSYKLQTRAARVGFDWDAAGDALEKLEEEMEEIREITGSGEGDLEMEMGDLLFSVVNVCRHIKLDPEVALHRSARKFRRRFRGMEEICEREGTSMEELSLAELDRLWDRAKREE
jgi:tetrapyrrole methylase family protein/MazG family protein